MSVSGSHVLWFRTAPEFGEWQGDDDEGGTTNRVYRRGIVECGLWSVGDSFNTAETDMY